jgi:excinuclease ABC subunit A
LDEPTTSLHPADVELLITQLHKLVDANNSVVIVEHQLAAIASADWMIDLGPGGGDAGGRIIAQGPPLELARDREVQAASRSAQYLARHLLSRL